MPARLSVCRSVLTFHQLTHRFVTAAKHVAEVVVSSGGLCDESEHLFVGLVVGAVGYSVQWVLVQDHLEPPEKSENTSF